MLRIKRDASDQAFTNISEGVCGGAAIGAEDAVELEGWLRDGDSNSEPCG